MCIELLLGAYSADYESFDEALLWLIKCGREGLRFRYRDTSMRDVVQQDRRAAST